MCKFFLIIFLIISDLESIYNSRFGSQELAIGTASATRAAGDEKVSEYEFHMRLSNDILRV